MPTALPHHKASRPDTLGAYPVRLCTRSTTRPPTTEGCLGCQHTTAITHCRASQPFRPGSNTAYQLVHSSWPCRKRQVCAALKHAALLAGGERAAGPYHSSPIRGHFSETRQCNNLNLRNRNAQRTRKLRKERNMLQMK